MSELGGVDPSGLHGKKIAILFNSKDEAGEEEWAVLAGRGVWDGEDLRVSRGAGRTPFLVPHHALARLRPVQDEVREIFLDADVWLPLFVGPLPEDADHGEYESTGLNWHDFK